MGYSQDTNCCIDSKGEEAHRLQNGYGVVVRNKPISSTSSSLINIGENRKEIDFEVVSLLQKMVWELGLRCVLPGAAKVRLQQQNEKKKVKVEQESGNEEGSEHNKSWLLAESSAVVVVNDDDAVFTSDPQSVHSSFRFSFGSQIEFDALCLNSSSSGATTVLMVNLDNGLRESQSKDLKWRRMESLERSISPVADTLTRYSYAEIRSATQNFYKGRVLGRGALSCVFRGRVGFRRTSVAIKRLDKEDKECSKAFVRELMIASSLDNRNIVPLIGFCIDPDEGLFLVYKYVSGGSLEHHLHEKKKGIRGRSSLSCSVRFKIAIGIAEAVAYLHNGTERCVVHRDIKPSNILLSSKKTPKLCDFGLATWTDAPSVPFLCKTVKGTFGYLAPEYFQHGKVSDKTDVYAFGVVLLELITGRKPIETKRDSRDENLVLWAKPLLEQGSGAIGELLDPKLKLRPHNSRQMTRMVEAAAACINSEESRRPSIDEVISILRGEEHNGSPNKNKSSFSGCLTDCYAQSNDLQTKSDLKSHLALAMLGVSDLEDDDHLYSR